MNFLRGQSPLDFARGLPGLVFLFFRDLRHRRRLRRSGFHFHRRFFEGQHFAWYSNFETAPDDSDDRPVIVCLHGFLGRALTFRKLMPLLAPDFRVMAFDLPGHGSSSLAAIRELWTVTSITRSLHRFLTVLLGKEKPFLLTHSMGGLPAFRMALATESQTGLLSFSGIIAMAPGVLLPSATRLETLRRQFFPTTLGEVRNLLTELAGGKMERESQPTTPATVPDVICRALLVRWSSPGFHYLAMNTMDRPEEAFLQPSDLNRIRLPCLLIWGKDDPIIDPALGKTMLRSLGGRVRGRAPEKSLIIIEGAGHGLPAERPEEIAGIVREAIRRSFRSREGKSSHNRQRSR